MIYDISVPFQNFPLAKEKHLIQGSTSLDSRKKIPLSSEWLVWSINIILVMIQATSGTRHIACENENKMYGLVMLKHA